MRAYGESSRERGMSVAEEEVRRWRSCAEGAYVASECVVASELMGGCRGWDVLCSLRED